MGGPCGDKSLIFGGFPCNWTCEGVSVWVVPPCGLIWRISTLIGADLRLYRLVLCDGFIPKHSGGLGENKGMERSIGLDKSKSLDKEGFSPSLTVSSGRISDILALKNRDFPLFERMKTRFSRYMRK